MEQMTNKSASKTFRPGRIRERNHEIILAAAEQEFALHGFRGATIQNIAERAELPKSNVLYYFSNKKKIYAAMFDDILARWNAVFSSVTVDDDPAEALASFYPRQGRDGPPVSAGLPSVCHGNHPGRPFF